MPKYKIDILCPDGTTEEQDEIFDSQAEAEEYGVYLCGCYEQGKEILFMSNPGNNPIGDEHLDYEVFEVDD
jgi:hypothetical protein